MTIIPSSPNERALNIPNTLSLSRICAVPLQLLFAYSGNKMMFLILFLLILISDTLDGIIARKTNQESEIGSLLDSLGDFATYLSLPFCIWGLWPKLIQEETTFIIIACLSFLCPVIIGYIRFRSFISFHTWSTKFSAVLFGITIFLMICWNVHWPFRLATPIFCLAGLETIAIAVVLPSYHTNIYSLKQALDVRRYTSLRSR